MKSLRFVPVLFVVLVVLLLATPVFAESAQPPADEPIIPPLRDALALLLTTGGLGVVISFLCEGREWFQKLSPGQKMGVVLGLCLGLPVAAQLALDLVPPDWFDKLNKIWYALALGFGVFLASQWYHGKIKEAKEAAKKEASGG